MKRAYGGGVRDALAFGVKVTGCTVHIATEIVALLLVSLGLSLRAKNQGPHVRLPNVRNSTRHS